MAEVHPVVAAVAPDMIEFMKSLGFNDVLAEPFGRAAAAVAVPAALRWLADRWNDDAALHYAWELEKDLDAMIAAIERASGPQEGNTQ